MRYLTIIITLLFAFNLQGQINVPMWNQADSALQEIQINSITDWSQDKFEIRIDTLYTAGSPYSHTGGDTIDILALCDSLYYVHTYGDSFFDADTLKLPTKDKIYKITILFQVDNNGTNPKSELIFQPIASEISNRGRVIGLKPNNNDITPVFTSSSFPIILTEQLEGYRIRYTCDTNMDMYDITVIIENN